MPSFERQRCAAALACLGLLASRAGAAQAAPAAAAAPLPRGVVIERVACAGAPEQSYALYLPSGYADDRRFPILYAFDPGAQGARPVRLAAAAAERFGWIVAGSNNSRNGPMAAIRTAVAALVADAGSRLAIDPRRVYATGLSGGARVAAGLAIGSHGGVAGVFAQSAGLPVDVPVGSTAFGFAWFATAGERDMNYAELFLLEQELDKRGVRQRFRVFDGGHEWAPPAVWSDALSWFELLAMHDGLRPRDGALTASLLEAARARAAAFQARAEPVGEARELESMARDFDGLVDTAPARLRLEALRASPAYRKALARERRMIDEQASLASELQREIAELKDASSDEHAALVLRANRDANGLAHALAGAKQPDQRLVYERVLSQVYVGAMETARAALRQEQRDVARMLFDIAAALRPDVPAPLVGRAELDALAGRKGDAVRSLRRALGLGLKTQELARIVDGNQAFEKIRTEPELRELVASEPRR